MYKARWSQNIFCKMWKIMYIHRTGCSKKSFIFSNKKKHLKTMMNSIPEWLFLEIGKMKLIWLYLALLFFRTCTLHHVQQIKKDMAHIFYQILCLWNLSCVIARMTNNLAKTHVYIFYRFMLLFAFVALAVDGNRYVYLALCIFIQYKRFTIIYLFMSNIF